MAMSVDTIEEPAYGVLSTVRSMDCLSEFLLVMGDTIEYKPRITYDLCFKLVVELFENGWITWEQE